jgi:hypothetical protein
VSPVGRTASRAVVAVLATAAAGLPATASAAASGTGCSAGHGVGVIVESNSLPEPDLRRCDETGGGHTVASLLERQDLAVTYVQRQPGFLCRLAGFPAGDPCVHTPPEDAYWSLWWSDGSTDGWRYATIGVDGLRIPNGGSLALTWDGKAGEVTPVSPPLSSSVAPRSAGRAAATRTDASRRGDAGLPAWVGPAAVGLLLAAAGTVGVRRRRAGPPT